MKEIISNAVVLAIITFWMFIAGVNDLMLLIALLSSVAAVIYWIVYTKLGRRVFNYFKSICEEL